MLKPSLQLRIGQQLTMTPQLQQAIRLLQLPALELQAHIRELLETNVMLEPMEESEATGTFEAVVTAAGMVSPPTGRVYQVWVMSPSGARSAGLMAGSSTLLASAVVPGDRIGITVEPAGGTSKPTTTPVAVLSA